MPPRGATGDAGREGCLQSGSGVAAPDLPAVPKRRRETSLGRWMLPFTDCRLPLVVSVVTITVAPLRAQIPPLAMAFTSSRHAS